MHCGWTNVPEHRTWAFLLRWVMSRRTFLGIFSIGAYCAPSSTPYLMRISRPIGIKKCLRWRFTPSEALKTVVLSLFRNTPLLNTPKNARRKRGYLTKRLNSRKLAVAVDVAGKHHLHSTLLHGLRRSFTPQQILAQGLGTTVGQAHRVLIDDIGKNAAA